jgi:glycine betaine/proline transport system substrate-binding protein
MKKILTLICIVALSVVAFAGCNNEGVNNDGTNNGTGNVTEDKGTVRIAYVNWSEGVAMTNLVQVILEDKLGYDVEITMADAGPVFTSVANGDQDFFLDAWLPVTHETYMEQYGDQLVSLGLNFEGARIGLVVPDYVEIDSIEEMNDVVDQFGGRIVGIDAGAGIMGATDEAIAAYGLDYELLASSGPMMAAELEAAIDDNAWVAVTGWQPHWKFARWNLKFLEDPQGIFGAVEDIYTVARLGFEEDMPEVASFLKNFYLDDQQLGDLMGQVENAEGITEAEAARQWMNENEEVVNGWLN